jgi:putative heme iron utilization protein
MDASALTLLKALLTDRRVASVAVLADGEPAIGLLPFAAAPDFDALVVNVSHLARHSKGLVDGAPFDALLNEPEVAGADPLQLPRVTLRGRARVLQPGTPSYDAARAAYVAKFPQAEAILDLGGFRLVHLGIEAGRMIAGFAGAVDLTGADLTKLAEPGR